MNSLIRDIFITLESAKDEEERQRAIVQLVMLLERALRRPQMDEELCAIFLPEGLLVIELSASEIDEVFNEMAKVLGNNQLPRNSKMSLFWALTSNADSKFGEFIFNFFSVYAGTFIEQEALGSIAQLSGFLERYEGPVSQVRRLLIEFDIQKHLTGFQTSPSLRLQHSAALLNDKLKSILEN